MSDAVILKLSPGMVLNASIYTPYRFGESKYGYYGITIEKKLVEEIPELQPFITQPNVVKMKNVFIKTNRRVEIDTNSLTRLLYEIDVADATNLSRDTWLARQMLEVAIETFNYDNPLNGRKAVGLGLKSLKVVF